MHSRESSNEGASAKRHPPLVSAERRGSLIIGLACHAQCRVPVAELGRSPVKSNTHTFTSSLERIVDFLYQPENINHKDVVYSLLISEEERFNLSPGRYERGRDSKRQIGAWAQKQTC